MNQLVFACAYQYTFFEWTKLPLTVTSKYPVIPAVDSPSWEERSRKPKNQTLTYTHVELGYRVGHNTGIHGLPLSLCPQIRHQVLPVAGGTIEEV